MRVVDDERELYYVFSLSHLFPAFWVLEFGYVLSSAAFLAAHFPGRYPNFEPVAWPQFAH